MEFENVYYFKHLSCHFLLSQSLHNFIFSVYSISNKLLCTYKIIIIIFVIILDIFSPSIYSINIYISTKWPFDVFSFLFCSSAHFQSWFLFIFNLIFITHTSHIKRVMLKYLCCTRAANK